VEGTACDNLVDVEPWVRWVAVAAAAGLIVVLFTALRPDAGSNEASPTPSSPTPTATTSPTDSGSPSPSPQPELTLIEVAVRDGNVQGPSTTTARRGDHVRIVVRADVTDHVHLHGYDLIADVAPGRPAKIDFVTDAVGVYEVELEDAGRLLFNLEILP
jgi:hypothetical protein